MSRRPLVALLLAVAACGGARSADPGPTASAPADATDAGYRDEVCEEYTPTGSTIPRTRCYTPEEADQRRDKDRETVRGIQNRARPAKGN